MNNTSEEKRTVQQLMEMQSWPLEKKIQTSIARIIEFYEAYNGNVCVSYSGGKDSTVLLHLVRSVYPNVPALFSNTGLEYMEIQHHVRQTENCEIVRPKMKFTEVIMEYGYPVISKEVSEAIYYARRRPAERERERERESMRRAMLMGSYPRDGFGSGNMDNARTQNNPKKTEGADGAPDGRKRSRAGVEKEQFLSKFNKKKWLPICQELPARISHRCCDVMKKSPINEYHKRTHTNAYIGTMAEESAARRQAWIRTGCNAFDGKHPSSLPLSFWTEQDVLEYIIRFGLPYASVYGDIVKDESGRFSTTGARRTGCIFCCYGVHMEEGETRFQKLKKTHPKQYDYCFGGGQWIDNPDFDPEYNGDPDKFGWIEWNPQKIWVPSEKGLGYAVLFDMLNEIMANAGYKDRWRY